MTVRGLTNCEVGDSLSLICVQGFDQLFDLFAALKAHV